MAIMRQRITENIKRWINRIAGIMLIVFAVALIA